MTKDNLKIYDLLDEMHHDADCELNFDSPFELLVAVVLSAQCTDKRVNQVTSELFKIANTPEAFVKMPVEELERHIFSCGFYHNKAKAIKSLSQSVLDMGGIPEIARRTYETPRRRAQNGKRRSGGGIRRKRNRC